MANVKHTTDNGEILTTNCKRVATALKRFADYLSNYDNIYNTMLSQLNNDNNTTTFTDDRYNTITMTLTVNDSTDNYTLTIKHTHNTPKTIWCICSQDGTIKDFDDRKKLFEYAYKNNLYGDFDTIWIEEKELKDERFDYYETVDYEELDLYKIRTMLELDICDMKITNDNETATDTKDTESDTNTNKTPAELKAEINKKYGVNAVYYDTDSILCDADKQNVYVIQHNTVENVTKHQTYIIKAYYDNKELTVPYSEYKCKKYAVEYIHNLYINRVVPYETLFMIYYGKHFETITIENVIDTSDLLQYNIDDINHGLKHDIYKCVREGVNRICDIITDNMKVCIDLYVSDKTTYCTITKSIYDDYYCFKFVKTVYTKRPSDFARWLYSQTYTHRIDLKCWYRDLRGDTK